MKTVLLTGANGFLGSNIAKSLIKNYKVIGLARKTDNLFRLNSISSDLIVYSTLYDNIEEIFKQHSIDIILHTATVYGRKDEPTQELISTNYLLPLNLLLLGIKYNSEVFINTDTVLDTKVSQYAMTKSHIRDWLQMMSDKIKIVNIQLEHFYGPGSNNDNFIYWLILKLLNNESEIHLTKGEQKRDFLFIDDAISAILTIIEYLNLLKDNYTTIQIASGEVISIKELALLLKKLTKSESVLSFGAIPYRVNELMVSGVNNGIIKSLNWKSKIRLEQGLNATIDHIYKHCL